MGAECHVCGLDMYDRCGWCELREDRDRLAAELEVVKNERDLAVLTLAAFTPADKPLPTLHAYDDGTVDIRPTTEGDAA